MDPAKLLFDGKEYELQTVVGTEDEVGLDITKFRAQSGGTITIDSGYGNTGSCESGITFIDGEKGILRYRGYPIEQLAENGTFTEICYLLIHGELPSKAQLEAFDHELTYHSMLHEDMKKFFGGYPQTTHPMAILSAMVASMSAYYPNAHRDDRRELNIMRLLAKAITIAAFSYKKSIGQPFMYPQNHLTYTQNFLHMMFAVPAEEYEVSIRWSTGRSTCCSSCTPITSRTAALRQCAWSVRARPTSSPRSPPVICALWGPLHGGANQKVIEMLQMIQDDGGNYQKYVDMAKDKESGFRLMGFGHRVYKNFDPRARILKKAADDVLEELGVDDPLLEIAKNLEQIALEDEFFVKRRLYPNVDFYSGIIYSAIGIPVNMFTVMFALGRLPGWIAQWKEMREDPKSRINRPRQIYTGPTERAYTDINER